MKNKISVFALFTRSSLYRILSLFGIMAAVQVIVFYLMLTLPNSTPTELITVVHDARLSLIYGGTFLLMTAQLSLVGCEFSSKPGYILRRLSLSPRWIFSLQSLANACFYLLFWAFQALVLLGLSKLYMEQATPAIANHQTVYLSFYRSDFMHAILPLDEKSLYIRNIVLALGMGVATASVPHYQRLHRIPIVIFIITAVTLGFFVQELGSTSAATVISIFILIFSSISVYNIMTGGDSVEM